MMKTTLRKIRLTGFRMWCKKVLALAAMTVIGFQLSSGGELLAGICTDSDFESSKILGADSGTAMQPALNPQADAVRADAFVALPANLNLGTNSLSQTRANAVGLVGVSALDAAALEPGVLNTLCESNLAVDAAVLKTDSFASAQPNWQTLLDQKSAGLLSGELSQAVQISALSVAGQETAAGIPATASLMRLESSSTVQKSTAEPVVSVGKTVEAERPQVGILIRAWSERHTSLKQSVSGADFTATREYYDSKPVHFEVTYNNGPQSLQKQDVAISTSESNLITQTLAKSEAGEQAVTYNEKGTPVSIMNVDYTAGVADRQSVTQVQTDDTGRIANTLTESQAGRTDVTYNDDGSMNMQTQKADGTQEQAVVQPSGSGWSKITYQGNTAAIESFTPDAVMQFALRHNAGGNPLTQFVAEHNQKILAEKPAYAQAQ